MTISSKSDKRKLLYIGRGAYASRREDTHVYTIRANDERLNNARNAAWANWISAHGNGLHFNACGFYKRILIEKKQGTKNGKYTYGTINT